MTIAAFAVAVLALALSAFSVFYTRRATHTQEAADRRARLPRLSITAEDSDDENATSTFYRVRNDGQQDLDAVVVYRPRPPNGITYPIARVGEDWASDEVDLGPLTLTQEARFVLSLGSATTLPEFRVRILCRAGRDTWTLTENLEGGRRGLGIY